MTKLSTKSITRTALFTAVIAVLAQLQIPISPIPFSLTVFAVLLTGALLPPMEALLAAVTYLLLGGFGIPVFAGMQGGASVLFGLTGGFKLSYPLMAWLTAFFTHKTAQKPQRIVKVFGMIAGMLLSLAVCYLLGTVWYMLQSQQALPQALSACVLPFIPSDLLKIGLACALAFPLRAQLSFTAR